MTNRISTSFSKAQLAILIEQLAAIEHRRWAHWQAHVHSQSIPQPDGSLLIPAHLVRRWEDQISTPYNDLTVEEQDSDREQVQEYLPTLLDALSLKIE